MSDRLKKEIADILKSAEVRTIFQDMLKEHTGVIVHAIQNDENEKLNKELLIKNELKTELENIKVQRDDAEKKIDKLFSELDEYKMKLVSINDEKQAIESQLGALKENYDAMEAFHKEKEKQDEEMLEHLQQEVNRYSKYKEIETAFSLYMKLTEDLKSRLKNIFGNGNIFAFLTAIGDWNNVEGMWNFAKRRVIEFEDEDAEHLVLLFEFLFVAYTNQSKNERFELILPYVGDKYNSDVHSIKGVKTDGYITEVLLAGIYDKEIRKVIYKAVVKVQ